MFLLNFYENPYFVITIFCKWLKKHILIQFIYTSVVILIHIYHIYSHLHCIIHMIFMNDLFFVFYFFLWYNTSNFMLHMSTSFTSSLNLYKHLWGILTYIHTHWYKFNHFHSHIHIQTMIHEYSKYYSFVFTYIVNFMWLYLWLCMGY